MPYLVYLLLVQSHLSCFLSQRYMLIIKSYAYNVNPWQLCENCLLSLKKAYVCCINELIFSHKDLWIPNHPTRIHLSLTFEELISMNTKLNGVILVITAKKNMYYVTIKSVLSKLLDVFSLKNNSMLNKYAIVYWCLYIIMYWIKYCLKGYTN